MFEVNLFSTFIFMPYLVSMSLKGVLESSLLLVSKDKPLTPNIDKVIGVRIFKRRAQNTKKQSRLDISILVFMCSRKRERERKPVQIFLTQNYGSVHAGVEVWSKFIQRMLRGMCFGYTNRFDLFYVECLYCLFGVKPSF